MSQEQLLQQTLQSRKLQINTSKLTSLQPNEVYEYLHTTSNGLSNEESQTRLSIYGNNTIQSKKTFHPLKNFAKQLVNLMAIMLWVASILAIVSGTPLLSYVIWFIIIVNAIFSFVQEKKADDALQTLAKMIPNNVKVLRDGKIHVLTAEKIVPGDVVTLKAGDKVPADIRIVESEGLLVDNSMLTGESVAVDRNEQADFIEDSTITNSHNLLFAGTSITAGNATGVVYATGENSQIGNITQTSAHIMKSKSTLELQIKKITKSLIVIAIILGILAFIISKFVTGISINAALIFGIGIIVANIPEGLMPTVSLCLAMGVERMAKKNALVRKQSAVETLGSTTVICTDKTGTLTQNIMFAKKIWTADGIIEITGEGYGKKGTLKGITDENKETIETLFIASTICSDTVLHTDEKDENKWRIIGSPTEAAILIASQKYGITPDDVTEQFTRTKVIPFSSSTKTMSVLASNKDNTTFQFTKGDPRKVIDHCSFIFKNGQTVSLLPEEKKQLLLANDSLASEGYRLLAIAYSNQITNDEPIFENLTFLGLVAIYDPPKKEVKEAIASCYKAGIKVSIVTGDYSLTAAAIAKQIGLIKNDYVVITGPELEKMSHEELAKKINTDLPVIFARTTPKEKLKIVETYQSLGHVVASTGDGLNDVLALRKADIGISMGKNGSDAAIESSDIVLLDDNFATIVEAVKEGRAIFSNIQKFITYILASNMPEVIPFLIMGIFNVPLALTVLLVLAIDFGTDLIPAIALGREHPDEDVLDMPPRSVKENILNKKVLLRAYGFLGLIEASMLFVIYFFTWQYFGYSLADMQSLTVSISNNTASEHVMYVYHYACTLAFGSVIASQIGNVLICRSPRLSLAKTLRKGNGLIIWGIVIEVILFLMIAYVPFIQHLFGTTGPKLKHLALLLICPIILILFEEGRKWIARKMNKN